MVHIPDSHVERALDILKAKDHALARAAYEKSERELKIVLARAELTANAKTVGERQASALASAAYAEAVEQHRLVSEAYFEAKDKRDAADAIIRAWQTQQSDYRSMGRVA